MMYPTIFNDSLFDDLFDYNFPAIRRVRDIDRKIYGKNAAHVMKTDVREFDDRFEADIDLPGFKKDEISLNLENGMLTVSAAKGVEDTEKDENGRMVRRERYCGSMQRSYFVGKDITVDDVKARFEDGVLRLTLPKKAPALPEKKTIMIEG